MNQEQRTVMAELIGVDEVVELVTPCLAYRFVLRVGAVWETVEIEEPSILMCDASTALDRITRVLFETANALKFKVGELVTGVVLQGFIGNARPIIVPDSEMPPGSFEVRSGAQVVRVINVSDVDEKPIDRFAAVVLELEDL